jgi:hypothetical protein
MENDDSLERLVHDVNGKCSSIRGAVTMLRGEDSKDELELVALMSRAARSLAELLSAYETRRLGGRPK